MCFLPLVYRCPTSYKDEGQSGLIIGLGVVIYNIFLIQNHKKEVKMFIIRQLSLEGGPDNWVLSRDVRVVSTRHAHYPEITRERKYSCFPKTGSQYTRVLFQNVLHNYKQMAKCEFVFKRWLSKAKVTSWPSYVLRKSNNSHVYL